MKVTGISGPNLAMGNQALGSRQQRIPLSPGQVVQATVLATGSQGRLLVEIEGQQVWARSSIQAFPGQVLTLQVQALEPELLLRSLGPWEAQYQDLMALCLRKGLSLMNWETLRQLFTGVREEMEQAGFARQPESSGLLTEDSSPTSPIHWDLGKLLRASGLFLEAKLRDAALGKGDTAGVLPDLKAHVLKALGQDGNGRVGEGLLRSMLDMLVGAQSLALLGQERETTQWVAVLPPWWMPRGSWGDLRIGQWVKGPDGILRRGWCITLRMEIEEMGRIWARVYLLGELLGCEIQASREDVRERIQQEIESLKNGLEGLWPAAVKCSVGSLDESLDWTQQELELPETLVGLLA